MPPSLAESIQCFVNRRFAGSGSNQKAGSRPTLALSVLSGLAFLSLAIYCVLSSVAISAAGAKLLPNQTDNTYPESTNIYAAIQAAQTGHLYAVPSQPPYVLQPFGPLYYVINAAIARASHLNFELIRARARLLTYGCFILSAVIIFLICIRLRFSTVDSILAALLFLGQPYFVTWNVTVRPDMLFLMVMLLSLLCAVAGDSFGGAGYVLSGVLAGLAFLIKQPGIAVPIAVLMILLYRKKFRTAAVFTLSAVLPVVLVFSVLLWQRGPFLEQFTSVGKGIWSLREGAVFAADRLSIMLVLVPVMIGVIGFAQAIRSEDTSSQTVAVFAITNWVVGFSGLPQVGADVNYFLPGLAGCGLLLPFAIQMIRRHLYSKVYLAIIVLTFSWMIRQEVVILSRVFSDVLRPAERSYISLEPFKILSDRPIFTVHGRDADLLDPFTAHEFELTGHWDPSPILAKIQRGDYDLIILASGNWHVIGDFRGIAWFGPTLVNAMNENYRVLCSTLSSVALEPRVREVAITPEALGPALGQRCGVGLHGHSPDLRFPPNVR